MGDDGIGALVRIGAHLDGFTGNGDVHGLFNLAQIIDGNAAALAVGAVEGAAGDVQIQGIAMLRVVAGIGAADHIQGIGEPHVAGVGICGCAADFALRHIDIGSLISGHGVDGAAGDVYLTHAERNAAIDGAVGDGEVYFAGHINGGAEISSQGAAVDRQVHIAGLIVAGQGSAIPGFNGAAVDHQVSAAAGSKTIVIGDDLTGFSGAVVFNGQGSGRALRFNNGIVIVKFCGNCFAVKIQSNLLTREVDFLGNGGVIHHYNGFAILSGIDSCGQGGIISVANFGGGSGFAQRGNRAVRRLHIIRGNIRLDIDGELTTANVSGCAFGCVDVAFKFAASNRQVAFVHSSVEISVLQSVKPVACIESTAADFSNVVVLHHCLGDVAERTILDSQGSVIIILDGVDSASECAALNSQLGGSLADVIDISGSIALILCGIVIVAVGHQTGEMTAGGDADAASDGHFAVVENIVIAVAAGTGGGIVGGLLAAGVIAAGQRAGAIVINGSASIGHVINRAAAGNRQFAALLNRNGIAFGIGDGVSVQIQGDVLSGNSPLTHDNVFLNVIQQFKITVIIIGAICDGSLQRIIMIFAGILASAAVIYRCDLVIAAISAVTLDAFHIPSHGCGRQECQRHSQR